MNSNEIAGYLTHLQLGRSRRIADVADLLASGRV
jgi:ribosomal protein S17E